MDDPNITMEEYIRLEEEKARRCGKVYNWETATYGNICFDDVLLQSLYLLEFEEDIDFSEIVRMPCFPARDSVPLIPKVSDSLMFAVLLDQMSRLTHYKYFYYRMCLGNILNLDSTLWNSTSRCGAVGMILQSVLDLVAYLVVSNLSVIESATVRPFDLQTNDSSCSSFRVSGDIGLIQAVGVSCEALSQVKAFVKKCVSASWYLVSNEIQSSTIFLSTLLFDKVMSDINGWSASVEHYFRHRAIAL
ncbi:hypothetical protein Tco_1227567 [Tanacetum coccineum]